MEVAAATVETAQPESLVPSKEDVNDAVDTSTEQSKKKPQTNGDKATTEPEDPISKTQELKDENTAVKVEKPADRVREGQRYNNRPRFIERKQQEREVYRKNSKYDVGPQPETDDPIAIRKQVIISAHVMHRANGQRSNSTSQTQIFCKINSCSPKSRVTKTLRSL